MEAFRKDAPPETILRAADKLAAAAYTSWTGSAVDAAGATAAQKLIDDTRWEIGVDVDALRTAIANREKAEAAQAAETSAQGAAALDAANAEEARKRAAALRKLSQLQSLCRNTEVSALNLAAKSLGAITVVVTGLLTGFGFASGDLLRMYRDDATLSIVFFILITLAVMLGTFAVAIDGAARTMNFWAERSAVYVGILISVVAVLLVTWGLTRGTVGVLRPTISTTYSTATGISTLQITATASTVRSSDHIELTVWGYRAVHPGWSVVLYDVTGADQDGAITASSTTSFSSGTYSEMLVVAALRGASSAIGPTPPPRAASASVPTCLGNTGLTAATTPPKANMSSTASTNTLSKAPGKPPTAQANLTVATPILTLPPNEACSLVTVTDPPTSAGATG
jgi:hypothetical protein